MSNTIEDILEIRTEAISGVYEVVRTVGFDVNTAAGVRNCRLEAIRRAGQEQHEVLVTVRDGSGAWRRDPSWESETVNRKNADETLLAAVEHISRKAAEVPAPQPAAAAPAPPAPDEISPEILSVLAAAVAAFFGKKARIRGARMLRSTTASSAWAQQGRVYVQGSHNLGRG